jgi:hypothetical protein
VKEKRRKRDTRGRERERERERERGEKRRLKKGEMGGGDNLQKNHQLAAREKKYTICQLTR